jgi:hypothetical protein
MSAHNEASSEKEQVSEECEEDCQEGEDEAPRPVSTALMDAGGHVDVLAMMAAFREKLAGEIAGELAGEPPSVFEPPLVSMVLMGAVIDPVSVSDMMIEWRVEKLLEELAEGGARFGRRVGFGSSMRRKSV